MARHAGYRVGLYQKPELVHYTERCRVNGEPVAADALAAHFAAVDAARGDITLTLFEFGTLAIATSGSKCVIIWLMGATAMANVDNNGTPWSHKYEPPKSLSIKSTQ